MPKWKISRDSNHGASKKVRLFDKRFVCDTSVTEITVRGDGFWKLLYVRMVPKLSDKVFAAKTCI